MQQNDSDRIQTRRDQIEDYKTFKLLIGDTYNLSEIDLFKNERQMTILNRDAKRVIEIMLKYYKQNGFAFIYTLFTDDISKYQQRPKPKSYFSQVIKTLTNVIKYEQLINPLKQQLLQFSSTIIQLIEPIKPFLQSLPQGWEIKHIVEDLRILATFLQDIKQGQNTIYEVSKRSWKFMKLMERIYVAKMRIQQEGSSSTKKEIYLQAGYETLRMNPRNIFQEVTVNRLKKMTEGFLLGNQSQVSLPNCCTLYFRKQSYFVKLQSKNQQHKDYHWPITLQKILKHVRKTIVGFLNLEGGIVYIGIKEKPQCVQAKGIFLSQSEVVGFFEWLRSQCAFIYPKFQNQIEEKMQHMYQQDLRNLKQRSKERNYHYHVNKYVSVEFMTMVDHQTDMDIVEENKENTSIFRKLYMVKIKIKPGTKAETFHLLKQGKDGEIECYKRNDASVNKLTFGEFMSFYNERIEAFMNETVEQAEGLWNQCPYWHFKQFCKKALQ